jgi:hypothetical protein
MHMERLKPALLIIFLVFSFGQVFAHVKLLYPVGGEAFQVGEVVQIQWEIEIYHGVCNWDLSVSTDGGSTWEMLAKDLPESELTYDWTVPNIQTNSGRIKVTQDNLVWHEDYSDSSGNFTITISTGIEETGNQVEDLTLFSAFPNPFNPATTIRYSLSKGSRVSLKIYNVVGERVKTLVEDFQSPGDKSAVWDGRNDRGQLVSSGVYIYKLEAGEFASVRKMIFVK